MKNISCSLGRCNFGTLLVILLSFLVLSLLVQSCRLNQNVLVQAASMNQHGQGESNRLNLPDREGADNPSSKSFIPQSAILNPQSKAEVIRKTAKLQIPFIANEGQTDEKVAFYANTFGGTVFVTKDGEIVYSLPMVAHASPLVHYDIDKNETGYTGLPGYRGKEGQCIVHRALCTMYPYCPWNFPVYYSETNFPLCNTESNSPVCHSARSEESYLNNSQSEIPNPKSAIQNSSSTSTGDPKFEKSEVIQKTKKLQNGLVSYRKGEGYEK